MSFWDMFTGGKNPADASKPYYDQIPGATNPYFQPYFNNGINAGQNLEGQYSGLMNDPGGMMNKFGESYKESPGMKFAIQKALQASGNAAASGGMAGSPQHSQQNMQLANDIASQDYNNWMDKALGLYGKGLSGNEQFYNTGANAGKNQADFIAQTLAQQGNAAFNGQAQKNKNQADLWGNIFTGIGNAGSGGLFGAFKNFNFPGMGPSSNMYGGG